MTPHELALELKRERRYAEAADAFAVAADRAEEHGELTVARALRIEHRRFLVLLASEDPR